MATWSSKTSFYVGRGTEEKWRWWVWLKHYKSHETILCVGRIGTIYWRLNGGKPPFFSIFYYNDRSFVFCRSNTHFLLKSTFWRQEAIKEMQRKSHICYSWILSKIVKENMIVVYIWHTSDTSQLCRWSDWWLISQRCSQLLHGRRPITS